MNVLVCGGRKYRDWQTVDRELSALKPSHIIHGGASGADALVDEWARLPWNHVPVSIYRADWDMHGRAAGPLRNQEMLDQERPDVVLAFPGGRGTADMVRRAKEAGVKVIEL